MTEIKPYMTEGTIGVQAQSPNALFMMVKVYRLQI